MGKICEHSFSRLDKWEYLLEKKEKNTHSGLGASCFAASNKKEKNDLRRGKGRAGRKKTDEVGWGNFQTKK